MTKSTLRRWHNYEGGKLTIDWIIYGDPNIRYQLTEIRSCCNALIAESYDKQEIENLLAELSNPITT